MKLRRNGNKLIVSCATHDELQAVVLKLDPTSPILSDDEDAIQLMDEIEKMYKGYGAPRKHDYKAVVREHIRTGYGCLRLSRKLGIRHGTVCHILGEYRLALAAFMDEPENSPETGPARC